MAQKTALITGITGQDGSYLAELLLEKGYRVCGMVRRVSSDNFRRLEHIRAQIEIHHGDLLDHAAIMAVINRVQPDEIYNLGGMAFVPMSWEKPVLAIETLGVSVTRILDAVRKLCPEARFFQPSSCEMYGRPAESPQSETTPFQPCTPSGAAKLYGHSMAVNYRQAYGIYACCGIMFNHESPRRGLDYVTRKVTHTAARIKHGLESELRLGDLQAQRDWGHAKEYVEAMWLTLQQDEPGDYVIGTGETHSVQEFIEIAFDQAGLDWRAHVVVDPKFLRPADVGFMRADARKARDRLGWTPRIRFEELARLMADADLQFIGETAPPSLRQAA